MIRHLTAAVTEEDGIFVAQCIEVEVASQGDSIQSAIANLREALELYFEDADAPPARPSPIIAPIEIFTP